MCVCVCVCVNDVTCSGGGGECIERGRTVERERIAVRTLAEVGFAWVQRCRCLLRVSHDLSFLFFLLVRYSYSVPSTLRVGYS